MTINEVYKPCELLSTIPGRSKIKIKMLTKIMLIAAHREHFFNAGP